MTVIAIRDGVMAADSKSTAGDIFIGTVKKIRAVKPEHGGGFVAVGGMWAHGNAMAFAETGEVPDKFKTDEAKLYHLRADGEIQVCTVHDAVRIAAE